MKFAIRFFVNSDATCVVENVSLEQVYSLAVPTEAFSNIPGNRWHVMMRQPALLRLRDLEQGEYLKIAWQEPPLNPELDIESTYVERLE